MSTKQLILLYLCLLITALVLPSPGSAQTSASPAETELRLYEIIESVSADRIDKDIRTLAGFGTRNT